VLAALKGHREPLEVLGEGAQHSKEVDTEDEVEEAQSKPVAGDVEGCAIDEDRHIMGDPLAREALATDDRGA